MIPDYLEVDEYDAEDTIIYDLLPQDQLVKLEQIRLILCEDATENIPWYAALCGCVDMAYEMLFGLNQESNEIWH